MAITVPNMVSEVPKTFEKFVSLCEKSKNYTLLRKHSWSYCKGKLVRRCCLFIHQTNFTFSGLRKRCRVGSCGVAAQL